jgi:ketosteroid isomerase-like protein
MDAIDALTAVCAAWEHLDADRLATLFADDGNYEDPLKERTLRGVQDIRDGNAPAMAALSVCEIRLRRTVGDATAAFAEGDFRSELRGGGRLDFAFALLVEMEAGKVRRVAEYFDTRPLLP